VLALRRKESGGERARERERERFLVLKFCIIGKRLKVEVFFRCSKFDSDKDVYGPSRFFEMRSFCVT